MTSAGQRAESSNRRPPHTLLRNLLAALMAALVAIPGILALGAAAQPASSSAKMPPPYATEADVTSLEFSKESVQDGQLIELNGTWALPDDPQTPAGFTVDLPPQLAGQAISYPLRTPEGEEMGRCEVTGERLTCDFDEEYLKENPKNLNGSFNLFVRVKEGNTETQTKTYELEGNTVSVEVTPNPGPCIENCEFDGREAQKNGDYLEESDRIFWGVLLKTPADGAVGGEEVSVVDTPDDGQRIIPEETRVQFTTELVTNSAGYQTPGNYRDLPADQWTKSADGSRVDFVTTEGYYYRVVYITEVINPTSEPTKFSNDAEITVDSVPTNVASTITARGGQGTGMGEGVGRFELTKNVVNSGGAEVEGKTYTGTYVVTAPNGQATEGTWSLTEDEPFTSPAFVRGSTVTLTEDTPQGPDGATWADPVFSANDFTLVGGEQTDVTLTNQVSVPSPSESTAPPTEPTVAPSESASPPGGNGGQTPASGVLPDTGNSASPLAILAGLLFVLVGVGALLMSRRKA